MEAVDEVEDRVEESADKEKQKAAKGVDSVTDFVQEKDAVVDASAVQNAIGSLAEVKGENQSNDVVLKEEDVKFLMEECEIPKEAAEALLRKNAGDLQASMAAFVNGM